MKDYDLFSGIIRINTFVFALNTILIFHFAWSWYRSYKKTGWKLDYWYLTLFLTYFFPFLLMYPFAGSILNTLAVGDNITLIQDYINTAYFINFVGYMSVFFGRSLFDIYRYNNVLNYFFILPVKEILTRMYISVARNNFTSYILYLAYFGALLIIMAIAAQAGRLTDPRAYFFENRNINFIYNFTLILSSIISLIIMGRIYQYNKLLDKICFGLYVVMSIFIGARSYIIMPLIQCFSFYIFFRKQGKIDLIKVAMFGFILLFLIIFLGALRNGESISAVNVMAGLGANTFYGNSFSDLRDFGFVLSYWDHHFYYGKTYLAGFMSFIPSFISSFRTEWSIGKVTASMVGFDPQVHPGLRPGVFGESYLNFGYFGVVFLGGLLGYAYRYIDHKIKTTFLTKDKLGAVGALISTLLVTNFIITAGFFSIYVFLFVLLALVAVKKAVIFLLSAKN